MAKSIRKPVSQQSPAPPMGVDVRAEVPRDELRRLIAEAAYYRAQQRGFAPGYEEQDWIDAEAEVMARLGLLQ
jgi:hypothetical protein